MKVLVLGGGASGIASAINMARKGYDVTILERNNNLGKKLLITGNGRCNFFNSDFDYSKFFTDDDISLKKIINKKNIKKVLDFFDYIGIESKIQEGYYYPFSNQAITFNECLKNTINSLNIKIIYNALVSNIQKKDNSFIVKYNDKEITTDKLVLSTGSKCYPKTGSDGSGYKILKQLGHSITEILPALTFLKTNDSLNKKASGVRCSAKTSLYINDKKVSEDKGQLQINKDNISGICIFNISVLAIKNIKDNKVSVKINFLDELDINENNCYSYLNSINKKTNKNSVLSLLEGIINYKLSNIILDKCKINPDKSFESLNKSEINKLINMITNYEVNIIGYGDFDKCQTCQGGVPLNEIDTSNMESKTIKNLYITGELLEPCGRCGGYNLGLSFLTGLLVNNKE